MSSLTFLHVSDLHFGEPSPNRGFAKWDADTLQWWALNPLFDGYLGHGYEALVRLEELYDELSDTEPVELIVSGDFTRVGSAAEFDVARRYLGGQLRLSTSSTDTTGLGHSGWTVLAVPGNHDQWPGLACTMSNATSCMIGPNPGVTAKVLGRYPRNSVVYRFGRYQLRLAMLDTDSDISPHSLRRFLAQGDFRSQLTAAAGCFGAKPKPAREIRGLIIHHSYDQRGVALQMTNKARAALRRFIDTEEIDVVFTGHSHDELVTTHHNQRGRRWYERRCGTTTQISRFPKGFPWGIARLQQAASMRRLPRNTALVHRFEDRGGGAVLRTQVYRRRRGLGPFEPEPEIVEPL